MKNWACAKKHAQTCCPHETLPFKWGQSAFQRLASEEMPVNKSMLLRNYFTKKNDRLVIPSFIEVNPGTLLVLSWTGFCHMDSENGHKLCCFLLLKASKFKAKMPPT